MGLIQPPGKLTSKESGHPSQALSNETKDMDVRKGVVDERPLAGRVDNREKGVVHARRFIAS